MQIAEHGELVVLVRLGGVDVDVTVEERLLAGELVDRLSCRAACPCPRARCSIELRRRTAPSGRDRPSTCWRDPVGIAPSSAARTGRRTGGPRSRRVFIGVARSIATLLWSRRISMSSADSGRARSSRSSSSARNLPRPGATLPSALISSSMVASSSAGCRVEALEDLEAAQLELGVDEVLASSPSATASSNRSLTLRSISSNTSWKWPRTWRRARRGSWHRRPASRPWRAR